MKILVPALTLLFVSSALGQKVTSFYSSTADKSVAIIRSSHLEKGAEIDFFTHLCPGYGGYELLHESGDARSWINVKLGKEKSDLMSVTFRESGGLFPYKENDVVEWRGLLNGEDFQPYAVIYRIGVQDPNDDRKHLTRLIVIELNGGKSKILGSTSGKDADAGAKKLADTASPIPPKDWQAWASWVQKRLPDNDGHGPDPGGDEWTNAIGVVLKIQDAQGHGPDPKSAEWRAAVEAKLRELK